MIILGFLQYVQVGVQMEHKQDPDVAERAKIIKGFVGNVWR